MSVRDNQNIPVIRGVACGCGQAANSQQTAAQRQARAPVRATGEPPLEGEFYMLEGITAAENDQLQRMANGLERRMFRQRIKALAKTLSELRLALRAEGLVRIRMTWLTCSQIGRESC